MTWIAGAFAVLLFAGLPGAVIVPRSFAADRIEHCGLICAFSIGINSFAIMLLSMTGAYRPETAWIWALILTGFSISMWVAKRRHQPAESAATDEDAATIPVLAEGRKSPGSLWWILLPILAIQAYKSMAFPFYSWDAIASWNRWARNFFLDPNYFAHQTFFYTQFHPWGISFPYMLMGSLEIQNFSHSLCFAHVLVLYAGVARLTRLMAAPPGLAFAAMFLTHPIATWVSSGYADIAATGYCTLSLALISECFRANKNLQATCLALAGGLCGGVSYMFKPSTWPIIATCLLATAIIGDRRFIRDRASRVALFTLGAILVMAPWLISPHTQIAGPQLRYVVQDIHGPLSRLEVLGRGIETLVVCATMFATRSIDIAALGTCGLLFVAGFVTGRFRIALGFAALTQLAIWLNTANYDDRAALPAIPAVAVMCACGLASLMKRIGAGHPAAAVCAALALACVTGNIIIELSDQRLTSGRRLTDWRHGENWHSIRPFVNDERCLSEMFPWFRDLYSWRLENPKFHGTLWTDAALTASVDMTKIDGGGRFYLHLWRDGQLQWRNGDQLLFSSAMLTEICPIDTTSRPKKDWQSWLQMMERDGQIIRRAHHGQYIEYEVRANSTG